MKTKISRIIGLVAVTIAVSVHGQKQLLSLKLISPDQVPPVGTFWLAKGPTGQPTPPMPCPPPNLDVPIYDLGDGQYLVDDSQVSYGAMAMSSSIPFPGDGESGGSLESYVDTRNNHEKFAAHLFSLIDTNLAATYDTNLYNACNSFPPDTNTAPTLQIAKYLANSVIIKANHFDYSAESERDFALLICDKVETPTWKSIQFSGASDFQDGWLVQGLVPHQNVSDPMFFLITNLDSQSPCFFRAVPYSGPQLELTGQTPYSIVSNTITLQATVYDLSGVTNEQFGVIVDGTAARCSLGTNNTISLNTKYNPNGLLNVYLSAFNNNARVYEPTNPPDNTKLIFGGLTSVPLDFENDTFLAFASDYASPEIGTNYILFVIDKAQDIEAAIYDPTDGHILVSYAGHVPYPATVAIPWNFTESDGVTPYTNDEYGVTFTAFDPTTLEFTNKIDRVGVRAGAGCFLSWQWEDPGDPTGIGPLLNQQGDTWVNQTLRVLYEDLYKSLGFTQYGDWQVGTNRNHSDCRPLDAWAINWEYILKEPLSHNSLYSDFTLACAHGSGAEIGGGPYRNERFQPQDLQLWLVNCEDRKNWRLRKAALWTCYSGHPTLPTAGGTYPTWPEACGIRDGGLQYKSFMRKNCGLFFGSLLPFGWRADDGQTVTTPRAAAYVDQAWVCGANQWPGGCDPTYSFRWAVQASINQHPVLTNALPIGYGYMQMPYSSVYDDELMMRDTTHVKFP